MYSFKQIQLYQIYQEQNIEIKKITKIKSMKKLNIQNQIINLYQCIKTYLSNMTIFILKNNNIKNQKKNKIDISEKIGKQIPLINSLIDLYYSENRTDLQIEFNSLYWDSFLGFIQCFILYISHEGTIESLKKSLDLIYDEGEIVKYLQYFGLNKIFCTLYPLANEMKIVDNVNDYVNVLTKHCNEIFKKCDKGDNNSYKIITDQNGNIQTVYDNYKYYHVFQYGKWMKGCINSDDLIPMVKNNIIKRHEPFIKNELKLLLQNNIVDPVYMIYLYDKSQVPSKFILHYSFNINRNLIGFNDSVYDLSTGICRNIDSNDMITVSVLYNFPLHSNLRRVKLNKLLNLILPDEVIRSKLLNLMVCSLTKSQVFLFTGDKWRKNTFIALIGYTFGDYCNISPSNIHANIYRKYEVHDLKEENKNEYQKIYEKIKLSKNNLIINCLDDNYENLLKIQQHSILKFHFPSDDLDSSTLGKKSIESYKQEFMLLLLELFEENIE